MSSSRSMPNACNSSCSSDSKPNLSTLPLGLSRPTVRRVPPLNTFSLSLKYFPRTSALMDEKVRGWGTQGYAAAGSETWLRPPRWKRGRYRPVLGILPALSLFSCKTTLSRTGRRGTSRDKAVRKLAIRTVSFRTLDYSPSAFYPQPFSSRRLLFPKCAVSENRPMYLRMFALTSDIIPVACILEIDGMPHSHS
jgi:hypothetical protein